jgi:hypothetical protein
VSAEGSTSKSGSTKDMQKNACKTGGEERIRLPKEGPRLELAVAVDERRP